MTDLYAKTSNLYSKTSDNYSNSNDVSQKADTKSVINKIWFDTNNVNGNIKQNNQNNGSATLEQEKTSYKSEKNINTPGTTVIKQGRNEIYVVNSEFGQFKSNRRYDPVYQSTSSAYQAVSEFGDSSVNNYSGK